MNEAPAQRLGPLPGAAALRGPKGPAEGEGPFAPG